MGRYWGVIGRWSRDGNVGKPRFGGESLAEELTKGLGIAGLVTFVGELIVMDFDERCEVLASEGVAREVGLLADEVDSLGDCSEAVARMDLSGRKDAGCGFAGDTRGEAAAACDVNGLGASVGKGAAGERAGDRIEKW